MTLSPYLRAAKRKGADPAAIYDAASADDLDAAELARLVSDLRESSPKWKLRKVDRDPLIRSLLEDGRGATWIAERLGCHARTVARVLSTITEIPHP